MNVCFFVIFYIPSDSYLEFKHRNNKYFWSANAAFLPNKTLWVGFESASSVKKLGLAPLLFSKNIISG